MYKVFSKYSIKFLVTVPILALFVIGIALYLWLHQYYQKNLFDQLQTQNANRTIGHLVPAIEERLHEPQGLKLFLNEIIKNNPEIYYIGLTTQGHYYLHAGTTTAHFHDDPIYIKRHLNRYPHILLEAVIDTSKEKTTLASIQPLSWYGVSIGFGVLILGLGWVLIILRPLRRLVKIHTTHANRLDNGFYKTHSNELFRIAQSYRTLASSNRSQKRHLERLNVHLEELVHAKTSSLKAEIEENAKAKKRLEISNEEKTILLKEVHHRVKNNLAIIVGLIRMQSRRIKDQSTKSMFVDLQNRIKTMELIHTNLYTTARFNKIMMKEYLSLLVKHLNNSFTKENETVTFSIQCDEVSMDIDQAITCAQIINELVTNAYKHAFKDMEDGHIWIRITDLGEHFELQIEDNGNGGGSELSPKQFSLGLSLVHELTRYQLKGTVKVSNEKGLKYVIVFRKKQF